MTAGSVRKEISVVRIPVIGAVLWGTIGLLGERRLNPFKIE